MIEPPLPHLAIPTKPSLLPVVIWSILNVVAFLVASLFLLGLVLISVHKPVRSTSLMIPLSMLGLAANLWWIVAGLCGAIRKYNAAKHTIVPWKET
jgi:hypothetical protein